MTQPIDQTLAERGSRYGEFDAHSDITQGIKEAMRRGRNWEDLPDDMKEALEMVAHKAGRILNGDPDYIDSWTDIIGYARLVEKRLCKEQEPVIDHRVAGAEPAPKPKATEDSPFAAFFEALKTRAEAERAAMRCDDPECPACHPETSSIKRADVEAAIALLVKAGVISVAAGGSDDGTRH